MIEIRIVFLGPSRDAAGVGESVLSVPSGSSVADLKPLIWRAFPRLEALGSSMRIAVNEAFVSDDHIISTGDEIATIPPVSGGQDDPRIRIHLAVGPIPEQRVFDFVGGDPELGGICTFIGSTRSQRSDEHGALMHLEYEAYEAMAAKQLGRLALAGIEQFGAGQVAIAHRIGIVPVGARSVIIAVASAHRNEAFEACRWIIDTLKQDVPIWKQDVFEDGFVTWVQPPDKALS